MGDPHVLQAGCSPGDQVASLSLPPRLPWWPLMLPWEAGGCSEPAQPLKLSQDSCTWKNKTTCVTLLLGTSILRKRAASL